MPEEPYEDIAIAAPQARPYEAGSRDGLMQALCGRRFGGELDEIPDISSPITASEAQAFVYANLGIMCSRTMWAALNACWLRLMAARTAEQRLSLERMITAFAIGIGMTRHKEAAKIIASNEAARVAKHEADAHERALDRWRHFPASNPASDALLKNPGPLLDIRGIKRGEVQPAEPPPQG